MAVLIARNLWDRNTNFLTFLDAVIHTRASEYRLGIPLHLLLTLAILKSSVEIKGIIPLVEGKANKQVTPLLILNA